jgi:hypothetical protein
VADWTRTYDATGEVDEYGVIRKIRVVPKLYQLPPSTDVPTVLGH